MSDDMLPQGGYIAALETLSPVLGVSNRIADHRPSFAVTIHPASSAYGRGYPYTSTSLWEAAQLAGVYAETMRRHAREVDIGSRLTVTVRWLRDAFDAPPVAVLDLTLHARSRPARYAWEPTDGAAQDLLDAWTAARGGPTP